MKNKKKLKLSLSPFYPITIRWLRRNLLILPLPLVRRLLSFLSSAEKLSACRDLLLLLIIWKSKTAICSSLLSSLTKRGSLIHLNLPLLMLW
jgi:hypothetical protein